MSGPAGTRPYWEESAIGWTHHADRVEAVLGPLGAPTLAALELRPGDAVLDIGCGSGGTTAAIAARVTPGGRAVGIDVAPPAIAAARRRHPVTGTSGPHFAVADAQTPVSSAPAPADPVGTGYDAVHSRLTLMVLPDPAAAVRVAGHRLRPGGVLAASVFREASAVPWLAAAFLGAAAELGPVAGVPEPGGAGPFALADPRTLAALFPASDWQPARVVAHDGVLELGTADDDIACLVEIGPAGSAFRAAGPQQRRAAVDSARRLVQRCRRPDGTLPAGCWVVTARRLTS